MKTNTEAFRIKVTTENTEDTENADGSSDGGQSTETSIHLDIERREGEGPL
jgi:hypothetical protein